MPPTQPSPGSHPSRLLPKTHPACIAQVSLAGSTTIDDEKTDYFTEFGWTGFKRCELRLEQQPTFEPHAALALAVCWPNAANPPPMHPPAATGQHCCSWSTAANLLALLRCFSTSRSPVTSCCNAR